MLRHRTHRGVSRSLLPALLVGACGASMPGPAVAQVSQCRIDIPRSGLQGADLYVNDKNEAYVIARFGDPRFDDTSEVFRLRDCKSVASGVTAKSNFAQTFRAGGFREHALPLKGSKDLVNSIYGRVGVTLAAAGIEARVNTVTPERLAGLQALKDLVTLRRVVPAAALRVVAEDEQLALLDAAEFTGVQPNALPGDVLARLYFGLADDYRGLEGSRVHRIIAAHYPRQLTDTVRSRLPADAALAGALDEHFLQRSAALPPSAGEAEITAVYARMGEVGHHSPTVVRGYLGALAARTPFETLLAGFRSVHEAAFLRQDTPARREVAQLLDAAYLRHVEASGPAIAAAATGHARLAELGHRSPVIRQRWIGLVAERGSFDDIVQLVRSAKADAGFSAADIGQVAALTDAAVLKQVTAAPNRMAAVTAAYTRLLAAGYGSMKLRQLYMETALAAADLNGAIQLHRHIADDADFRGEAGTADRARDLAARRYAESVSSATDAQAASVARDGLIKLDAAGLKTVAAVGLCEATLRRSGKFQDAVDVFRATGDRTLVERLQVIVRTDADRAALERIAVASTQNLLRVFEISIDNLSYSLTGDKSRSFWAGNERFRADATIQGTVVAKLARSAPFPVKFGKYRLHMDIDVRVPRTGTRRTDDLSASRSLAVDVDSTSSGSAAASFKFDLSQVAFLEQRGVLMWTDWVSGSISANPTVAVRIKSVEYIP